MTTPFDEDVPAVTDAEATTDLPEVDVPEALDDETDAPAEGTTTTTDEKPKAEKKPARDVPPEGYITPVQFAKELTKHLEAQGAENKHGKIRMPSEGDAGNVIPPQQMYSTLNQKNSKNPMPTYVSTKDGQVFKTGEAPEGAALSRVNLLVLDEALAWWDAKGERVAARNTAAAEKDAKKAAKSTDAPAEAEADNTEVVEAE